MSFSFSFCIFFMHGNIFFMDDNTCEQQEPFDSILAAML